MPLKEIMRSLCRSSHPPARVGGTAVFPGGVAGMTPTAFMHNFKHNRVLHQTNIFLAGTTDNVPHVKEADRVLVEDLGDGCYAVTLRHGFMEFPDVPALLSRVQKQVPGWTYDVGDTSFSWVSSTGFE
jgi:KUP system potassium uptake protein